jgi:hypothetical protein
MNMAEELDRLESVKKKKKDLNTSEMDMQFKSINFLADRLGDSNPFALEGSSPASSCSDSDLMPDETEFFKDIMKVKADISFSNSLVRARQNLYSITDVVTKEMEQESKRKSRFKSQATIDSKANSSKAAITPGQSSRSNRDHLKPSPHGASDIGSLRSFSAVSIASQQSSSRRGETKVQNV